MGDPDIFLSYTREDQAVAMRFAEAFTAEGLNVWWDATLRSGEAYDEVTEAALRAAKAVVVLWSPRSVVSRWVRAEATIADRNKTLVPVTIEPCERPIMFELVQTAELSHWQGDRADPAWRAFASHLCEFVGKPGAPAAPTAAAPLNIAEVKFARKQLSPLVGREDELRIVDACLDDAAAGRGNILLIGGEPGVGKTRLAEAALEAAQRRGMLPLVGHAYEERGAPYIVATEIIEETMRLLPAPALRAALGDGAPEIARIVPTLRALFPDLPPPTDLPPEQLQRFLFNAILGFVRRLSASIPLVMLLDDFHWSDESSTAMLEHVAAHVPDMPVLYVATYREVAADMGESFRRALANLTRQHFVRRIALKQLTRENVADLLTTLGRPDPPAALVEIIFTETEGNAFFVQSVFQSLAEEGKLFATDGAWRSDFEPGELSLPDNIRLVIERRLERLSAPAQELLNLAATLGLRFEPDVLEAMSELDDEQMIDAIEEAEAANLIIPSTGRRETRYEFSHALVRQTLLENISPLRRERHHLKAATAIEALCGEDPARAADIAKHLYAAGKRADPTKTVLFLKLAGERARAAAAAEEAVLHFDRALAILPETEAEQRSDLLHLRGTTRLALRDNDGGVADLDAGLAICEAAHLPRKAAIIAAEIVLFFSMNGRAEDAVQVVRRAGPLIEEGSSKERTLLLAATGSAHAMRGNGAVGRPYCEESIALARQLGDRNLLAEVLHLAARADFSCQSATDCVAKAREAADLVRTLDRPWLLADCLWLLRLNLTIAGRFAEADAIESELVPLATAQGYFGALGTCFSASIMLELARGDVEASNRAIVISGDHFISGGHPWHALNDGYLLQNQLLLGNDDAAREVLGRMWSMHGHRDTTFAGVQEGYLLSGAAHLGDERIGERLRAYCGYLPQPGALPTVGGTCFLECAIEALVLAGDREGAAHLYPLFAELLTHDIGTVNWSLGLHLRFAGMAAAAGGDWDQAKHHFDEAVRLADELPHLIEQPRVRYWYARMMIEGGQAIAGREPAVLLAEARRQSEDLGLRGLIRWIDALPVAPA